MDLMILASLFVLAGAASAVPIYSVPVTYVALPSIPENIYNQVQDTKTGEYAFGYAGGPVAREEARTVDGVIRGAYSYVDAHGIVQHYRYIADDGGFRVAGSNVPTDTTSGASVLLEPQRAALKTEAVVAEAAAVVDESKKAETEAETSGEAQSRKKRGIVYGELPVAVEAVAAPLAIAAVPTATSTQSRVQIHNSLKSEVPVAVAPVAVAAKAIEVVPGAVPVAVAAATPVDTVAATVPLATSSQSRYQIHKSLKAEIPVEAVMAAAPATPSAPAAIVAQPIAAKSSEVASETSTAAASASESLAVSSESSSAAEKSAKVEISAVEATEDVAAVPVASPAVVAVEPAPKAIAALPVAAAPSVPTATSSQSRFQIHKTLKTVIQEPLIAVPLVAETIRAAAPLVGVVPVAAQTLKAIPENSSPAVAATPLAATATSEQRLFQVHKNEKLELNALHQPLTYGVLDIHPAIALQPVNSGSLPLATRSPVGVGLGVVPSPVAAYYGAPLLAQA